MNMNSSISIRFVGFLLLIMGVAIGFLFSYPPEWPLYNFVNGFYTNVSTELVSIAITVLVIDYLYQRREDEQLKYRLVWEMGSKDQGFALRAVKELRARKWLFDGTLKNQDLSYANLEGADLKEADFENATLIHANLKGAHLEEGNLKNANLAEAVLHDAHLEESVFQNSRMEKVRLQKAHLYRADLKNVDLLGALLQGAELRYVDLEDARLEEADLRMADLTGAKLRGANLLRANLKGAVLRDVDLRRANLSQISNWREIASLENTRLSGVINPPDGFLDWAEDEDAIL